MTWRSHCSARTIPSFRGNGSTGQPLVGSRGQAVVLKNPGRQQRGPTVGMSQQDQLVGQHPGKQGTQLEGHTGSGETVGVGVGDPVGECEGDGEGVALGDRGGEGVALEDGEGVGLGGVTMQTMAWQLSQLLLKHCTSRGRRGRPRS